MIDLLLGGSPCQGFSFAGKQLNFFDPRSKLFFDYVKALEILKPKYFLLENVKMKKEYQDVISKYLGVEPIEINSALVSEQNRARLYWSNIPNIKQPEDRKVTIQLEQDEFPAYMDINRDIRKTEKFACLTATYWKGIRGAGRPFASKKVGNYDDVRKYQRMLTPEECERLQTLPIGYTEGISNTQRYTALGNGWTIDVIVHILSFIPDKYLQTVVSLFDGISCGQVALERAGKVYNQYYASEIQKHAIQVTMKNYPHTMQLGDVTKIDWEAFKNRLSLIQKVS
ncbi:DNA cytosine methyltransferase [Petroclostridium sp. X23]|uniref:DNA cytosine methyltransferase n=1 Tax=Petroclostridium sp. X23 TaxID=3045146 RepID=UPI0024ACDA70|nr:DNA cytosine methyltransferase [Petroclostridium sp. X23]WHH58455.1 DNA cytosine methyltransferase [Petroclostridium sp. X23]